MSANYSWQIQKSVWLMQCVLCGYVLALIACFLNSLMLPIQFGFAGIILSNGFVTLKRLARENWRLNYDEEDGWQLHEFEQLREIQILPSTVLSRRFLFLHYEFQEKKFYRIIFKDALGVSSNSFRELLVMLLIF